MTKRRPRIQLDDDEWVTIAWMGQHEECCGCGRVHTVDFRVERGNLQMKARTIRVGKKP
jgi:hypothetical protein